MHVRKQLCIPSPNDPLARARMHTLAHTPGVCAAQGNPHTQGNPVEAMVVVLGSMMVLGMCVAVCLKTVLVYQVRLRVAGGAWSPALHPPSFSLSPLWL